MQPRSLELRLFHYIFLCCFWQSLIHFVQSYTVRWEPYADSFRGHIFVTPDNSTIIISVKLHHWHVVDLRRRTDAVEGQSEQQAARFVLLCGARSATATMERRGATKVDWRRVSRRTACSIRSGL